MNLFESRLRISSAENPDLYADARPHSAMVARRNGTVPGDARHSYPTYSSTFLKRGSLVVRRSFPGSLLPVAHRLSFELRYANSRAMKDGRDRVRRKSTDIKSSSLNPCLGKQCTTLRRKCKRASHLSRVGEAFIHTLVRSKMKSCTL